MLTNSDLLKHVDASARQYSSPLKGLNGGHICNGIKKFKKNAYFTLNPSGFSVH